MASVKVQAKLSTDDLLKAIDQLDKRNLESFLQKILVLVAGRKAPSLPQNEAELLQTSKIQLSTGRYFWTF